MAGPRAVQSVNSPWWRVGPAVGSVVQTVAVGSFGSLWWGVGCPVGSVRVQGGFSSTDGLAGPGAVQSVGSLWWRFGRRAVDAQQFESR